MGCGPTLHVMSGGLIMCLSRACPDPGAVTAIISDPEFLDVVEFGEDGWRIIHPLRERVNKDLFRCPVHTAVATLEENPEDGRYRASIGEDGELHLEKIPPEGS